MSKVICDICGTVYPESSENCPVCGCSRDFGLDAYEEEFLMDTATADYAAANPQDTKKKTREIFDFDEVNRDDEADTEDDRFDDDEEDMEESESNTVLVVILLILIVLLLVTAGFFFVRYFLPNMAKETELPTTTETVMETVESLPEETSESNIPCSDIVIPGGKIELGKDGLWLMNVQVYPENTTDVLAYVSYDESVATVDESGTVTAVGEGETVIEVSCGNKRIKCNVVVDYSVDVATETAGVIPAPQVEATEATEAVAETTEPGSTDAAAETTEPASTEATQATEPAKETTGNTELKLKKTDITMFSRYSSVDLELDCDIPVEDIKWFTMDSTVAIVHDGTVTATGSGITRIYGEYGGQQVECIVRCSF